jgi:amino acid transporter
MITGRKERWLDRLTLRLRRALGKWDLTAIGVNQVIGSAIFLLPSERGRAVGPWGPLAFMAVGLLSLSIALVLRGSGQPF